MVLKIRGLMIRSQDNSLNEVAEGCQAAIWSARATTTPVASSVPRRTCGSGWARSKLFWQCGTRRTKHQFGKYLQNSRRAGREAIRTPALFRQMSELQKYRQQQVRGLPRGTGVYTLCDLDEIPIYVGQSPSQNEGIQARTRRHLTSARSDAIASRQIDVWEVAYVWAWPLDDISDINELERSLYYYFDPKNRLMNGKVPPTPNNPISSPPSYARVQILPDAEIAIRKRPDQRLLRQIGQFYQLMDHILMVKDAKHLRNTLAVHFMRLQKYYHEFLGTTPPPEPD